MSSQMMPPRIGPATGPTSVVIAQSTVPSVACSLGNTRSSSICESGMIGPPTRPSSTRPPSSMPQRGGQAAKQRTDGEAEIAGEEHALRAEVPGEPAGQRHGDRLGHRVGGDDPGALRSEETPREPAIVGTETLAMVVSSTTRKLPSPMRIAAASSVRAASAAALCRRRNAADDGPWRLRPGFSWRRRCRRPSRARPAAGGRPAPRDRARCAPAAAARP